jgi:hypothetical protein
MKFNKSNRGLSLLARQQVLVIAVIRCPPQWLHHGCGSEEVQGLSFRTNTRYWATCPRCALTRTSVCPIAPHSLPCAGTQSALHARHTAIWRHGTRIPAHAPLFCAARCGDRKTSDNVDFLPAAQKESRADVSLAHDCIATYPQRCCKTKGASSCLPSMATRPASAQVNPGRP